MPLAQPVEERHPQHAYAVYTAAAQVDRGGFGKIFGGAGYLAYLEARPEYLRQHLVVEHEIVGVDIVVDSAQHLGREGPVAGMILGEFLIEQNILREREYAVGHIFEQRHAPFAGTFAQDARGQDDGIYIVGDDIGHRGYQFRGVLVIGVHHDDDVGTQFEGAVVASLLVAAVALVALMHENLFDTEPGSLLHGIVFAAIVGKDYLVDDVEGNFVVSLFQCPLGIVGGHDDNDFFILYHDILIIGAKIAN